MSLERHPCKKTSLTLICKKYIGEGKVKEDEQNATPHQAKQKL